MSKGVVLCAINNGAFDYAKLAASAARRTKRFLDVPVCLLSDEPTIDQADCTEFDIVLPVEALAPQKRMFRKTGETHDTVTWHNSIRSYVYSHTPFDQTLTFDVDFVLNTDCLKHVFDAGYELMANKTAVDLDYKRLPFDETIGQSRVPMYWSTVYYFTKTYTNDVFFNLIKHIHDNWVFYCYRYSLFSTLFRNDYAFSIANHILSSFNVNESLVKELPYPKLLSATEKDILIGKDGDRLFFKREDGSLSSTVSDIHVMHKYSLEKFICEI